MDILAQMTTLYIYTINWLGGKTLKICYGFCVISIVINVCEVYCTSCIKDNVKKNRYNFKGVTICILIIPAKNSS